MFTFLSPTEFFIHGLLIFLKAAAIGGSKMKNWIEKKTNNVLKLKF